MQQRKQEHTGFDMYNTSKGIHHHYHSVFRGNIKDSRPVGTQNLFELISQLKYPSAVDMDIIAQIRNEKDEAKRSHLKTKLRSYTPCVLVREYRRLTEIEEFSGLMSIDFDKIPDERIAHELKYYLFNEIPEIYASWISSSGKGVRALVHCERMQDVSQKKEFWALFNGFYDEYIKGLNIAEYFDNAPKNLMLPLFQSYDPDLLYRNEAPVFKKRRRVINAERKTPPPFEPPDSDDARHCMNITRKAINKITDNGHPQLRGAAFALGGYVGAGYLLEHEALNLIYRLIEGNNYLSQKASVYKETAKTMIKQGASKPLYLNK